MHPRPVNAMVDAVMPSCSGFCGSDGACCRRGESGHADGVACNHGAVGCASEHCCVHNAVKVRELQRP